jgi:molybdenum cofactor guanylyltransferase
LSLPACDVEGFVLAGGRSSRMGQDKALIQLGGRPLVQHALDILRGAGLDPRIGGARADLSAFAHVVTDEPGHAGLGPLAGIRAALAVCERRAAVFLPVDLPLIPAELIEYLIHHALITGAAVTVVSVGGFTQTFPAVIDRAAATHLRARLNSEDRNCLKAFRAAGAALPGGFTALQVELLVQPGQVRHPRGLYPAQWFLNVNSPEDLKVAESLATGPDPA